MLPAAQRATGATQFTLTLYYPLGVVLYLIVSYSTRTEFNLEYGASRGCVGLYRQSQFFYCWAGPVQ